MSNKNSNIVKIPRAFNFNLGLIIFVVILAYLIINIYNYYTAKHITYYEVDEGSIQMKTTYSALALRDEKIVYSYDEGDLNYYIKDNSRAKKGSLIASIDEDGYVSSQIYDATDKAGIITEDSKKEIADDVNKYIENFDNNKFYDIYRFKDDMDASLMEAVNLSILNSISEFATKDANSDFFHKEYAPEPGIVAYYYDGYENVTTDNFTPGMLDRISYQKNSLKGRKRLSVGDPLYKLITSEDWNLVMKADDTLMNLIGEESVIKIRFREDDTFCWSYVSTREIDGEVYLILSLNNSLIRYASERFIDIDIVTDKNEGLKIPNSAITSKVFFTVPEELFSYGGDNSEYGVLIKSDSENAKEGKEFVPCDIYYNSDGMNYICESSIVKGSKIYNSNNGEYFSVGSNAKLNGVYNINKGYAVFKLVEAQYNNDEYTIIKKGTKYGISMYDHIALDSTLIDEGELISQ